MYHYRRTQGEEEAEVRRRVQKNNKNKKMYIKNSFFTFIYYKKSDFPLLNLAQDLGTIYVYLYHYYNS